MPEDMPKEWQEGKDAAVNGWHREMNPYSKFLYPKKHNLWFDGWAFHRAGNMSKNAIKKIFGVFKK